jgi:hypothetical protein
VRIDLPEPFGRCRCIEAGPGAASLLTEVVGSRTSRVYVCFMPALFAGAMLVLNALGIAPRLPLSAFTAGRGDPPAEPSRQPTCHWVEVRRGRDVIASRFVCGDGDYRMSVAATAVVADALLARARLGSRPAGMFGIDEIMTLSELEPALATRGITILRSGPRALPSAA